MSLWNFSHKPDSDWGEDDSSGKAVQPDHYPNVARPGGGYPEGKGKESDTPCKTCNQNNLVDGRCPLCDWPNSVSEPIKNFPLDPFRDDKAGIRAASWKFSNYQTERVQQNLKVLNSSKTEIVEKFEEIYNELGRWEARIKNKRPILDPRYVKTVEEITGEKITATTIFNWWKKQKNKEQIVEQFKNNKRLLFDQNKQQIVEKFEEIYNELGRWDKDGSSSILDPRYVEVVEKIMGPGFSPRAIRDWWKQQEERQKIQRGKGSYQTIKKEKSIKLLDQNNNKLLKNSKKFIMNLEDGLIDLV